MRYAVSTFAAALIAALALHATPAHAQVVISGQVTSYTAPTGTTAAPAGGSSYVASDPAPTRYIHRSQNLPQLWVPGLILLVAGWAVNVLPIGIYVAENVGIPVRLDWYGYGVIPVVGPFLQFLSDGPQMEPWSIITGVAQVAGLVMFILGLTLTEEWDEPVYVLDEENPRSPTLAFGLEGASGGGAVGTVTLTYF